jgi:hypothetical protein
MMMKRVLICGAAVALAGCLSDPSDGTTTKGSALTTGAAQLDYSANCTPPSTPTDHCTVIGVGIQSAIQTTMHCCALQYGMQGLYVESSSVEDLYCRSVSAAGGYDQGTTVIRNGSLITDRSLCHWRDGGACVNDNTKGIHEYMIGFQQSSGRVACCPIKTPATVSGTFLDGPGQSQNSHTMDQYLVKAGGAYICENPDYIHTCGQDVANAALMYTENISSNVFGCVQ